jgi:hypothetical protein
MRALSSLAIAVCLTVSVFAVNQVRTAEAAFHCIRIHAVMGGFNGNNNVQYVELRMDVGGQTALFGHKIQFFDASGTLKAEFTFPTMAWDGTLGTSVLVGTSELNSYATGGAADLTFAGNTVGINGGHPLHPVQLPGGYVVWANTGPNCNGMPGPVVDSVAYGSATGIFGTAAPALPATGTSQALRLSNLNTMPMDNSMEYSLQNVSTTAFTVSAVSPNNLPTDLSTPRNNRHKVLLLSAPAPPRVGGVAELPDPATARVGAAGEAAGGGHTFAYLIAAAAAVVAAAAAGGGGWYLFRRRLYDRR